VDTWAWIEYWRGGDQRIQQYLDSREEKLTSVITVAEI
jgi:predicted nucleic acid-binding protein